MMRGALALHLRAEVRRSWRALVATIVLVGVIGGLVVGTLAGARRTDSAFDRLLADTESWDVLVNPAIGTASELTLADVESIPSVREATAVYGMPVFLLGPDGEPLPDFASLTLGAGEPDSLQAFGRPNVVSGRLLDNEVETEVMVAPGVADDYGLVPGDRLDAVYKPFDPATGQPGPSERLSFSVAGIVVPPDQVVDDDVFSYDVVFFSHAFTAPRLDGAYFVGYVARLDDGPGAFDDVRTSVAAAVPGELVEYQRMTEIADTVDRGVRPHVIALLAFATVMALVGGVVAVQAVLRQLDGLRQDARSLQAIGLDGGDLRRAARVRVLAAALGGASIAVVVAVLCSPIFPVGIAARAEVDPGVDVDALVLGPGALGIIVLLLGACWRSTRRVGVARAHARAIPDPMARRPIGGPVLGSGLRLAFAGRTGASMRSAIAGIAAAITALAATLTFGSSLTAFLDDPPSWGWGWDVLVSTSADTDEELGELGEDLAQPGAFSDVSVVLADQVEVDGVRLPAVGFERLAGEVGPSVVRGRQPERVDEIALGGRTMDDLGVDIGDVVAGRTGDLSVVGQAVFVGLGTFQGADRADLGAGALLTADGLEAVGEGFGFPFFVAAVDDRSRLDDAVDAVAAALAERIDASEAELRTDPQRPADVINLDRVGGTPTLISAVLVVLATAAFAHAVRSTSRASRRELGLLKAVGMSRRDLLAVVGIQSVSTALLASAIGIPAGIVLGRWAWTVLGDQLGIVHEPVLPPMLSAVIPAAVVVAALVAVPPGARAARTRASVALRED